MHAGSPEGLPKIQMLPLVLNLQASRHCLGSCLYQVLCQYHDVVVVCVRLQRNGIMNAPTASGDHSGSCQSSGEFVFSQGLLSETSTREQELLRHLADTSGKHSKFDHPWTLLSYAGHNAEILQTYMTGSSRPWLTLGYAMGYLHNAEILQTSMTGSPRPWLTLVMLWDIFTMLRFFRHA